MPPSPSVVQMLLPFMEKLALSPRAEQTANILEGLRGLTSQAKVPARLVEGYGAIPAQTMSPWKRAWQDVPKGGLPLGEGMALFPENGALSFLLKPRGQGRSLSGSIGPGDAPDIAHVAYMGSEGSGRVSTGAGDMPMMNYQMDIGSPAQRAWNPFPGEKLTAAQKAQRVPRIPEERERAYASSEPPIPLATKQSAMDRLLDFFRQRGVTKLAFEAEPGERPRLYQSLMGYKAEPQGATKMEELLRHMPGRQGGLAEFVGSSAMPARSHMVPPVTAPGWRPVAGRNMTPEGVEMSLGMETGEAKAHGLAEEIGPNVWRLTDYGAMSASDWLGLSQ